MKIAFITTFFDRRFYTAKQRVERNNLHRELPLELAARGHQVGSFFRAPEDESIRLEQVLFTFKREAVLQSTAARMLTTLFRRDAAALAPISRTLDAVAEFEPEILHVHCTIFHLHLRAIRKRFPALPIFLHHHGGDPARHPLTRSLQRQNFSKHTLLVSAPELAEPFFASGALTQPSQVGVLMESSSNFRRHDRLLSRSHTGMSGHPVCLSVARLEKLKDHRTLLAGFARIYRDRPRAQLYLCYSSTTVFAELRDFLDQLDGGTGLADAVHWVGEKPHPELEWMYNSADFFLQSSRREWSGYSALEAMACGAIPVLSNIPSYRQMTAIGTVGSLFNIGDDEQLANAVLQVNPSDYSDLSVGVRAHFETELSFAAMARTAERLYLSRLRPQGSGRTEEEVGQR